MKSLPWVLIGLVVCCFVTLAGLWFNGWAVSILWNWFIVPLGACSITLWHGAGIALLIGYLTYQVDLKRQKSEEKDKTEDQIYSGVMALFVLFVRPLIAIGLGWFIHTYFMVM